MILEFSILRCDKGKNAELKKHLDITPLKLSHVDEIAHGATRLEC